MRELETCPGICRERKLELVSGGEYDAFAAAAAVCRVRIGALRPVVEELASAEPRPADLRDRYESVRERGRVILRGTGQPSAEAADEEPWSGESTVVWRCPDCGGLEASQPCIGVCIWRPLEWVEAGTFASERARGAAGP